MENTKNLTSNEGIEKLRELVKAIDICLFSTHIKRKNGATFRPMSARQVSHLRIRWELDVIASGFAGRQLPAC